MKIAATGCTVALAGAGLLASAIDSPVAEASTACNGSVITINSGKGAEAPSKATGHGHNTGNHYVKTIYSNRVWEWWADNNGGSDGDTWDTYYGVKQC